MSEIKKLTEAEARIVAHICGDGCMSFYKSKRPLCDFKNHPRKDKYRSNYAIYYTNTESVLLKNFEKDVKEVYNLKTSKNRATNISFKAKWVYERIKSSGGGNSYNWFIADEIFTASKLIQREWLKAFFDDESYVDLRSLSISLNSVNLDGLKQVRKLLRNMNIKNTTFNGPYSYKKCKSYRLRILKEDVERYGIYVGFNHPKKKRGLEELLDLRELTHCKF